MAMYYLGEGDICLDRRNEVSQPNNEPKDQRNNQTANQPAKGVTTAQMWQKSSSLSLLVKPAV